MDSASYHALGLVAPRHRRSPPVGPADLASLLDRALATVPESEALTDPARRLTYRELGDAVDAAAALLWSHGVRPGDRVAGSLANSCDIVIGFMATQRIGAVWVGLNRVLSPLEKAHNLRHSRTKLMLVDAAGAAVIAGVRATLPDLETLIVIDAPGEDCGWSTIYDGAPSASAPRPEIDPFAPATIMYTSGTTGAPKGVVHSQHNMVTLCAAASAHGMLKPHARRGVVLPLTITNLMILGPLIAFWNGEACVCGQSVKVEAMVRWVHEERIGHCSAVPTMIYDLLEGGYDLPEDGPFASGGAPLPMPIRNAYKQRYCVPVGSSYGLTEAPTIVAETCGLDAPAGASGLVMPHIHVSIRNPEGDVLPVGEVGEICVGPLEEGPWANVYTPALGYWQDEEKTAKLLQDGVLHTGDMGRLDAEGWLYLADRSSELILRGGSNVYPGEIENVLHDHPAVGACAVVGQPDLRLGMRTVAFVQPNTPGADVDALREGLVKLCQAALARYKMPDDWIFVESFQRNAMGKIVKPALRALLPQTEEM